MAKDGVTGLYRGNVASSLGIMPYVGLKMASFDILKTAFGYDRTHPNFIMLNLCTGSLAGAISITFTYPIDLLRRRLQLSGQQGHPVYNGLVHCTQTTIANEGY